MRNIRLTLALCAAALAVVGCERNSASTSEESNVPGSASSWVHWIGTERMGKDRGAAGFMKIWNQPDTTAFRKQTLDKLSTAPWRLLPHTATASTNTARFLRPLLDDLLQEESYLEIRHPGDRAGAEYLFAIRLDAKQAGTWKTNLALVLESLTGLRVAATSNNAGWLLRKHDPPNQIELVRVGDWTLAGAGHDKNRLLEEMVARIQRDHAPVAAARGTNFWFDSKVDLRRVTAALPADWKLKAGFPEIALRMFGDGDTARTRGELSFSDAMPFKLPRWRLPTNLVHEPIIGFSAVRELPVFLASVNAASRLPILQRAPEQFYLWHDASTPFNTFFAWPVDKAASEFKGIAAPLTNWLTPRLGPNSGAPVVESADTIKWQGLPFAIPFLQAVSDPGGQFMLGGLGPTMRGKQLMTSELARHLTDGTNLLYFDWEITGQRFVHWRYIEDITRILFDARGPILPGKSTGLKWAVGSLTNLSQAVTEIRLINPHQLTFARKSAVGFTAVELNFLVNWLESPEFPGGLQALLITNTLPVVKLKPSLPPEQAPGRRQ